MSKNEFKDWLFDLLNETDDIPIQDLTLDDINDTISVELTDETGFLVYVGYQ